MQESKVLVFETDPDWKPNPSHFSNRIHVPPIWEVDSEGNRTWYIPPPGCRPSRPTSRDFDDRLPVSAITFSSVAPDPGVPPRVPPVSFGTSPFTIASASGGGLFTIASTGASSASTTATAEAEQSADPEEAPKSVDLRTTGYFHPIWNQDSLGSCAAHALSGAFTFAHQKQLDSTENHFEPSRLFLYYNIRVGLKKVREDDGGSVFEGMLSLLDKGVCAEEHWKYRPWGNKRGKFFVQGSRVAREPPPPAYEHALEHTVTSHVQLNVNKSANPNESYEFDLDELRKCLDDGYPFAFGSSIFNLDTFRRKAILEVPEEKDNRWVGHAMMGVGYDDNSQCFIIQNSWGSTWNKNGCFMMSYDIIAHPRIAYDFWTIRAVKTEEGGGEEEKAEEKQEENEPENEKEKEKDKDKE